MGLVLGSAVLIASLSFTADCREEGLGDVPGSFRQFGWVLRPREGVRFGALQTPR
jgi:hypothetical protein